MSDNMNVAEMGSHRVVLPTDFHFGQHVNMDPQAVVPELTAYPELQEILAEHSWAYEGVMRIAEHHRDTLRHSLRVARISYALAKAAFPEDERLAKAVGLAGILHDEGKIFYPRPLLDQKELSDDEYTDLKLHPLYSFELIRGDGFYAGDAEFSYDVARIAVAHHEFVDLNRSKYPRTKEDDIAFASRRHEPVWLVEAQRIVALADQTDTQLSQRSYSNPKTPAATEADLKAARDNNGKRVFSDSAVDQAVTLRTQMD